jgi:hypothetical protein
VSQIILSNGIATTVEEQDFLFFNQWNWFPLTAGKTVYAYRNQGPRNNHITILLHREIIERTGIILNSYRVDHKDTNGLNNLHSNLRIATHRENLRYREKPSHNTSGYKGVSFDKKRKRFEAYITDEFGKIHLGYFDSAISAAVAYNHQAKMLFGEFAWLNEL